MGLLRVHHCHGAAIRVRNTHYHTSHPPDLGPCNRPKKKIEQVTLRTSYKPVNMTFFECIIVALYNTLLRKYLQHSRVIVNEYRSAFAIAESSKRKGSAQHFLSPLALSSLFLHCTVLEHVLRI